MLEFALMLPVKILLVLFALLGLALACAVLCRVFVQGMLVLREPSLGGLGCFLLVAVPMTVFASLFGLGALGMLRHIVVGIVS